MNKNHFYEDGEPQNGIVKSMLDQVACGITGLKINSRTSLCEFTEEQVDRIVEFVIFMMAANLGYKSSMLTMLVNEKLNPIKESK